MCGLFAIINKEEDAFDYRTFCTLGVANDRRGGDSCGIFIDGEVEYGIKETAKFENFFWTSKLLNEVVSAKIALGHDRKASVGGITLEKAHPIIIKDATGLPEFVLIHNGTIHNYEDLAKKYIPKIKIGGLSDSQILALIIYHSGFDVLSEYNGGTAFICVDYRSGSPVTYFYKGESKEEEDSKEVSVERPLYYFQSKTRMVFSSIPSYLTICSEGEDCYELKGNTVFKYVNGLVYKVKQVDRSKCFQKKKYSYPTLYGGKYSYADYEYSDSYYDYRNDHSFYITLDEKTNRYLSKGTPLDGLLKVSAYGRCCKPNENLNAQSEVDMIWFFHGIAMKDKKHCAVAKLLLKKSGLNELDFLNKYENVVRFLSADGLYFKDGLLVKAISPTKCILYTGKYHMITSYYTYDYVDGKKYTFTTGYSHKLPFIELSNVEVKSKDLFKLCTQSMKEPVS